jgi:Tfp pilus assembly protein PilV
MSDAYSVGAWHRYIQWRGRGRSAGPADAGITLIELMVAIVILTVGLLGLLGGIATDIKAQAVEKSQAAAIHLADAWFETEQAVADEQNNNNAPSSCQTGPCPGNGDALFALYSGSGTSSTQADQPSGTSGITYNETRRLVLCAPGKVPSGSPLACTGSAAPPSDPTLAVLYALDTVTWSLGESSHTLTLERELSDDNQRVVSNPSAALGNCGGTVTLADTPTLTLKAVSSTNVTLATLNPTSGTAPLVDVSDAGLLGNLDGTTGTANVAAKIFVDLAVDSNENASCIPLQWTDINGGHEVQLAKSGSGTCLTANDYCATITANPVTGNPNIDQTATSSTTSTAKPFAFNNSVTFSATVPGYTNSATADQVSATMNVVALPTVSACQITVLGGITFNLTSQLGSLLGGLLAPLLGLVSGTIVTLTNGVIAPSFAPTTYQCTVDNRLSTDPVQVNYTDCANKTTTINLAGSTASNSPQTWLFTLTPPQTACPASAPRKPAQTVTVAAALLGQVPKANFTFTTFARTDGKTPTTGTPVTVQAAVLD